MCMNAKWITSGLKNNEDNSLPPEIYRKTILLDRLPQKASISLSALGIYDLRVNGKRISNAYFLPGYTHYESYVQFETFEIGQALVIGENTVEITVANGWWLGTLGNKNNRYGECRALIAEILLDETSISTDASWLVSCGGPVRYADFYNGEMIDLTRTPEFHVAVLYEGRTPALRAHYGAYVKEMERLTPVRHSDHIYDFGQNHAGVLQITVKAAAGTTVTIRHGELLTEGGELFTANLRTAKQALTLVCREGVSSFSPRFTFMGFRYAEITSDQPIEILEIYSSVLSADCPAIGDFSCSNDLLNKLYRNTWRSQLSNFIDIPTDCPQRDERMGWTGDIAVFAQTAATNRDISAFMRKWLTDLRLYQRPDGAIPVTIPENNTFEPMEQPLPIALWGDAATMVPWAVYRAYGDLEALAEQYESMKAYVEAELRAAAADSEADRRYLWDKNPFQFGDWLSPGEDYEAWIAKGNDLATPIMANSVRIVRDAAYALGKAEDAAKYEAILQRIKAAFCKYCLLPDGKLTADYPSGYVCALYFDLIPSHSRAACARRLAELVREADYTIGTGFAGTPYILFALADNGYVYDAYRLLLNEKCPGWLFPIKAGATSIWERWDALGENGSLRDPKMLGMVSFNHYAYGAVVDFFYRRILGIESLEAGYRRVRIAPLPGGGLSQAEGKITTPQGPIRVFWELVENHFTMELEAPKGICGEICLPDGSCLPLTPGVSHHEAKINGDVSRI